MPVNKPRGYPVEDNSAMSMQNIVGAGPAHIAIDGVTGKKAVTLPPAPPVQRPTIGEDVSTITTGSAAGR